MWKLFISSSAALLFEESDASLKPLKKTILRVTSQVWVNDILSNALSSTCVWTASSNKIQRNKQQSMFSLRMMPHSTVETIALFFGRSNAILIRLMLRWYAEENFEQLKQYSFHAVPTLRHRWTRIQSTNLSDILIFSQSFFLLSCVLSTMKEFQ